MLPLTFHHFVLLTAAGLLLFAAITDWWHYLIANWLSASLFGLFVLYAFSAGSPDFLLSLAVGAATLLVGLGLYAKRWIGGGDVKLMAALATWAGPALFAPFLVLTALAGGLLTLFLLASWRLAAVYPPLLTALPGQRIVSQPDIPYGVAIAAGGLYVLAELAGR